MTDIFLDWWDAHLFDFIVSGSVIGVLLVVCLITVLIDIIKGMFK